MDIAICKESATNFLNLFPIGLIEYGPYADNAAVFKRPYQMDRAEAEMVNSLFTNPDGIYNAHAHLLTSRTITRPVIA